ncbi:MAG: hypothetical protein HZA28_01195 [Candidatus Omnitrophica bacterium]|nr:hypothetical protein [Candidatus Omnitrophota bacterium]
MGYPTKVQLIDRKQSQQWYINFPAAVAQAMGFSRGEIVEWSIEDKENLILHRPNAPARHIKKKLIVSTKPSKPSGKKPAPPSDKSGTGSGPNGLP